MFGWSCQYKHDKEMANIWKIHHLNVSYFWVRFLKLSTVQAWGSGELREVINLSKDIFQSNELALAKVVNKATVSQWSILVVHGTHIQHFETNVI